MLPRPTDPPVTPPPGSHHLAEVVSVQGVGETGRIEARLIGYDGNDTQEGLIEARLCVPVAGGARGTFCVPDVGDEILVVFVNGDPRQAIVLGALWNGQNRPPEALGGSGDSVDRWTTVGKAGTRIAIVEESGSVIRLSTANDTAFCEISDGRIELSAGGSTIVLESSGVTVRTSGSLEMQSSSTTATSPTVDVNAAQTTFAGHVSTPSIQATTVIGTTYTPGAGNVW